MNKVLVSKKIAEILECVKDSHQTENEILMEVIKHRNGEYINFWSFAARLAENTLDYDLFSVTDMIRGFYEVEIDKNELISNKYKKNYETACTTPIISEQCLCNGWNECARYMNDLYKLNIKLEEK